MSAKYSRSAASKTPATMQSLEDRRLFAAVAPEATKAVDLNGPVDQMVEAGGQIYVSAPLASGGSTLRIYSTDGVADHSKLLLDLSQPGMPFSSIDDLAATEDGRVFFTATATGGRHLFELNVSNGKVYQLTSGTNLFYQNVKAAGTRLFLKEGNNDMLCTVAPGATEVTNVAQLDVTTDFRPAGQTAFFIVNQSLYRSDGTADGTFKISGDYTVSSKDFFAANDFVVFEGTKVGENTSLFVITSGATQPVKVADDFSLLYTRGAEVGGWVYFSGGYYNTSPLANGQQLYRVNAAGTVELASKISGGNGAGAVDGISAIGNFIYFTAGDSEFLPSQGTNDRELFKYNTISGETTMVTKGNTLYPVEIGKGALSSYYFVAAPDKENARFGSRALYRTDPITDEVQLVQGLPVVNDGTKDTTTVRDVAVGANGFFFTADTQVLGRENDVFFSRTPFSQIDPATGLLTVTGTNFADYTTMRVENDELIITQNGYEERYAIATVNRIEAFLGFGNDAFASDASVFVPTYVFGDMGDDRIIAGSGNDTVTGGAGRSTVYGGAGDDRLNGAGGRDVIIGEAGVDRVYGNGGNDVIYGGIGVDWVWAGAGDDVVRGGYSADKLFGEEGNDSLFGDFGVDWLVGGEGDDQLVGGDDNDTLDGGNGIDEMLGLAGDDSFVANDGFLDSLFGGDGNDSSTQDLNEAVVDLIETIL